MGAERSNASSKTAPKSFGSAVPGASAGSAAALAEKLCAMLPETVQGMRMELLQGAVVRLYYSKFTAVLYLATLLLAGVLLAITLGLDTPMRDAPGMLLGLEAIVSISLFTEVGLRAVVFGREYLRSVSNIL